MGQGNETSGKDELLLGLLLPSNLYVLQATGQPSRGGVEGIKTATISE